MNNSISGYLSAIDSNKYDPNPDPVPPANEEMKKKDSIYPHSSNKVSVIPNIAFWLAGPWTLYPYAQLFPDPSYFVKLNS